MSVFYGHPSPKKTKWAIRYRFLCSFVIITFANSPLINCAEDNPFLPESLKQTLQGPLFVFDEKANKKEQPDQDNPHPNAFRSTTQTVSGSFVCKTGLDKLCISGSSQFTANQIATIVQDVTVNETIKRSDFFIVDLRKEQHFFANGRAFAIFTPYLAGYAGQTAEEILSQEMEIKKHLEKADQLLIHKILEKGANGAITKSEVHKTPVDRLMTEEMLSTQMGVRYVRLGVQDHCSPDDVTIDKFLELVGSLPARNWIHFHCHGGKGRTSTFFLMYDILRNHSALSLRSLIDRQMALGGKDLENTAKSTQIEKEEAEKRLHFIHRFYAYATAHDGYGHHTWREWVTKYEGPNQR